MGERTRFAENGTSGFIDDETRAHGVAKESDIYALGVTMVLLLAKKCKPEGNPLEMLQRCHKCSSSMREVVRRMLLKRADRISLSDIKKHCETALNKEVQMGIELRNSENQRRSIDATDDSENGNTEPENREHSILSRLFSSPKVTPARDAKRSSGIQKQHKTKNESRNRTMTSWSEIISDVAYLFYDFVKSAKNK
ncbi:hypothetical protein C9374_001083 [Naegleria lovaniensis]|nr:uncharacterized protein C9374_001083 [Naegleria lovaniensis]KAG2387489.1 hypothetical protein C9374_001083 [Naegleria lovaniensis]